MIDASRPRLIIQIPCYNEQDALPVTLKALPRHVEGYAGVEVLVIDDGSTDATVEVARAHGVEHVVSHGYNRGLARAFMTGLETALKLGAHTIVNIDADNQYCAGDIPALVAPILRGEAMAVVGARPIKSIRQFSWSKKLFQYLGSWMVRVVSGTRVKDSPSGFRAIHRDAARRIHILSGYTYTAEMIIQLGYKNIPVVSVPVRVNEGVLRPSRLVRSTADYMLRSAAAIIRLFVLYRPLLFFFYVAAAMFALCGLLGARYLHFMSIGEGRGHVQSLLLATGLGMTGVMAVLIGFVCDGIRANRVLLEEIRYRLMDRDETR